MRISESYDPDRLELRSVLAPKDFGVALFFVCLAAYIYVDANYGFDAPNQHSTAFMVVAIGAALTALLWRRGSTVDRAEGTVTLEWGFLVPMFHRVRAVSPQAVVLERTMMWSDSAWFVHTISVQNVGGPPVFVARLSNITRAHAIAQALGEFLGVELLDRSEEAEFRVSMFGFDRWNADRNRSRWFYKFDDKGKPQLHEREAQTQAPGG